MKQIHIKVQCTQNEHHAKLLRLSSGFSNRLAPQAISHQAALLLANALAELLDGSSPLYIIRPGGKDNIAQWEPGRGYGQPAKIESVFNKGSCIGRCGICGGSLECTVFEKESSGYGGRSNEDSGRGTGNAGTGPVPTAPASGSGRGIKPRSARS